MKPSNERSIRYSSASHGVSDEPVFPIVSGMIHIELPLPHWWGWTQLRKRAPNQVGPSFSLLVSRRAMVAGVLLIMALLVCSLIALGCGNLMISPLRVIRALCQHGSSTDMLLINELRLPRVEAAIASGAGLALSGYLLQTITRNRLAVPDVIGIGPAATAGAVCAIAWYPLGVDATWWAMLAAFGAAGATFLLAGGVSRGGFAFTVIGLGVGAFCHALTTLILARSSLDIGNAASSWTIGSLSHTSAAALYRMWAGLAFCLPMTLCLSGRLRALDFADELIKGWGIRLSLLRILLLFQAVLCASLALALAGPIAMIGLMGPEMGRMVTGKGAIPVINAMLSGAVLMVVADTLGRILFDAIELPVGSVTALLGAPCLLWILFGLSNRQGKV